MRILQVIDTFSPAAGGPPEAVRELVRAHEQEFAGDQVEALCLDDPKALFLAGIPCPVHALGQASLGRFAFSPRLWRWLHHHARRFDVIIMHGIWSFPGIAVRSAARRAVIPYGVFVHGALDPWFNRMYPLKRIKKSLFWTFQYAVLRDAAAVFFTTAIERDLAKESFRPSRWNSFVIPLGIADSETSTEESNRQVEQFYARIPALRGRSYLLFMGRIHEKKGCDLLIEAFGRLAPDYPNVDLVMAGPDQMGLQARLQAQAERLGIAGRVRWPGMLQGDLKWGALRACEAFVLPSHQENFGITVVEALAAGRPVLISNQVNIWPEIQADGVGLVEDDTLEGAERLLRRWFRLDPTERESMAARGRRCFSARFTMSKTVSLIDEFFASERRRTGLDSGNLEVMRP
jgi:glycosyltransferase involved in cell wall biosynthesis